MWLTQDRPHPQNKVRVIWFKVHRRSSTGRAGQAELLCLTLLVARLRSGSPGTPAHVGHSPCPTCLPGEGTAGEGSPRAPTAEESHGEGVSGPGRVQQEVELSTSDQQPCHEPGRQKEARPPAQGWLPGQEGVPCFHRSRWPKNWVRMVLVTYDLKEGQSWARSRYGVTPKVGEQKLASLGGPESKRAVSRSEPALPGSPSSVYHLQTALHLFTQRGMWGTAHFCSPRNTNTLLGIHGSATLQDVTQEAAAPLCRLLSPHLHLCLVLCSKHTSRHAQRPARVAGSKIVAQSSMCPHWPLHSPHPM